MDDIASTHHRFSDAAREPCTTMGPIEGYMKEHIRTLEYAVEPIQNLVPNLDNHVKAAKERVRKSHDDLTLDQSAAIALYTMEWGDHTDSVFYKLNTDLRNKNRERMKPWFRYLRLLLSGLEQLQPIKALVYRGVAFHSDEFLHQYVTNEKIIWWGFSSCSKNSEVSRGQCFSGRGPIEVVFKINCFSGVDIARYSMHQQEHEILLYPGACVLVKSVRREESGPYVISLEEIESPFQVLESVPTKKNPRGIWEVLNQRASRIPFSGNPLKSTNKSKKVYESHRIYFNASGSVKTAIVTGKQFNDSSIELVIEQITENNSQELLFRENTLRYSGIKRIMEYLTSNETVQSLTITRNHDLDEQCVYFITEPLRTGENTFLRQLSLVETNIKDAGAKHLAMMLETNQTLVKLQLTTNKIGDIGFQAIVQSLLKVTSKLRHLALDWNKFGDAQSVQSIVTLLTTNRSLTYFNVANCKFTDSSKKDLKVSSNSRKDLEFLF